MNIQIINKKISHSHLQRIAKEDFGDMVKGVADIRKNIIALGGELHADAEAVLLKEGSRQEDLWGFNIYPARPASERIEFTSLINVRPKQGNRALVIQDPQLCQKIREIVDNLTE